jgi:hypothetical protein
VDKGYWATCIFVVSFKHTIMLYNLKEKRSLRILFKETTGASTSDFATPGFLPVADFRMAAVTRLDALKAAYLQQLAANEEVVSQQDKNNR